MGIETILVDQGWKPLQRSEWIAIKDTRPAFRAAFNTDRVGKIVNTSFHVTLTQFPEVVKDLIRQLGRDPVPLKSTNRARNATYWGFDTRGITDDALKVFVERLADAINDQLQP